jgi:hypothetical protein
VVKENPMTMKRKKNSFSFKSEDNTGLWPVKFSQDLPLYTPPWSSSDHLWKPTVSSTWKHVGLGEQACLPTLKAPSRGDHPELKEAGSGHTAEEQTTCSGKSLTLTAEGDEEDDSTYAPRWLKVTIHRVVPREMEPSDGPARPPLMLLLYGSQGPHKAFKSIFLKPENHPKFMVDSMYEDLKSWNGLASVGPLCSHRQLLHVTND